MPRSVAEEIQDVVDQAVDQADMGNANGSFSRM